MKGKEICPSKNDIFVNHIENHLKEMNVDDKVMCKICGKDIDMICQEYYMDIAFRRLGVRK